MNGGARVPVAQGGEADVPAVAVGDQHVFGVWKGVLRLGDVRPQRAWIGWAGRCVGEIALRAGVAQAPPLRVGARPLERGHVASVAHGAEQPAPERRALFVPLDLAAVP